MKEQVKEMFEEVTMPEETARKIRCSVAEKAAEREKQRYRYARRAGTVAAAFLSVIVLASLTLNTEVRAAVNEFVRYAFARVEFRRDSETGQIVDFSETNGETDGPVFVEAGDGKLYFSMNGKYIDITDRTSMETPYIYSYVDESNVEHMLIIGGVPDNFGVSEFYRENVEGQESWQGWIGGYSHNYLDNVTGKAYPWLAAAWEELDLKWPMPGA